MSIFDQLSEREPWATDQGNVVHLYNRRAFSLPTGKLGFRLLLIVLTVVFSILVIAYAHQMRLADWGPLPAAWQAWIEICGGPTGASNWHPLPEPWTLWLNTAALVLSSVTMQWARAAADQGDSEGFKRSFLAGGLLALAFVAGQVAAWLNLGALGYFASRNPADAFFFLVTGVHALHILGGLLAWGRTATRAWGGHELAEVRTVADFCVTYWHFLLVVWLVLFSLLLIS